MLSQMAVSLPRVRLIKDAEASFYCVGYRNGKCVVDKNCVCVCQTETDKEFVFPDMRTSLTPNK